jgi:hypothetical protein
MAKETTTSAQSPSGDKSSATSSQPMDRNVVLLGSYRATFEQAKSAQHRVFLIQLAVAVSSVAGVFISDPRVTYGLTIVALLGGGAIIFFNLKAAERKVAAERARRAHMLIDGLGIDLSGKASTDILGGLTVSEAELKKWADPDYYGTTAPPGPLRLSKIVQESAFWSTELFKSNARRKWTAVIVSVSFSLFLLLGFPLLPDQKALVTSAQLVCIGLSFLITRDLVNRATGFSGAARAMEDIDQHLESLDSSKLTVQDVLIAFGDYNAILEGSPPIESGLYKKDQERLSRLWKERQ